MLAAAAVAVGPERITVVGQRLRFGTMSVRCAIGRGGIRADKREGDGATPSGLFPLREVLYRADRVRAPVAALPVSSIGPLDGWSDDPADPDYNHRVTMPRAFHTEPLWRADHLYDLLAVIGASDDPVVSGRGSAIFLHVASARYGPTDGCVAVSMPDLLALLARCGRETEIEIRV